MQMGSLRVLNAMKAKHEEPVVRSKGLMFVDVKLNGKPVKLMVDTGATHNFITPEEAKCNILIFILGFNMFIN